MKKISAIGILFVFVASILAAGFSANVASAADVPVTVNEVKVDGDTIVQNAANAVSLKRGDSFQLKVIYTATADADNVEVSAFVKGSEHNEISATASLRNIENGIQYKQTLELKLPEKTDDDKYTLKLMFNDRTRSSLYTYNIKVDRERHLVTIKDITLSPANEVQTGRLLVARVLVKNMGNKTEDDVKVTASISELGVKDSYIIESIKPGKSEETGNLQLRIPNCADVAKYDVKVTVEYDDQNEVSDGKTSVNVVSGDTCSPLQPASVQTAKNSIITVIADSQDLTAGSGAKIWPITITNNGKASKAYTLSVDGADFADVQISPGNVLVVEPGKTQVAYISVGAKSNAQPGQHLFVVNINTGDSVEQVPMKANVVGSAASVGGLKKALEVVLVVFIVILVIVVLVVLFNKLRSNDDSETSGQTYY